MPGCDSGEVWACRSPGDRAGDIDQVNAIAWALEPRYRSVELSQEFERLREARGNAAGASRPVLPRAIVGIGRKRMAMAATIRAWSGGMTRLIHIGRARGHLEDLDYLVTTPAFPIGQSPKILSIEIALSDRIRRLATEGASAQSRAVEARWRASLADHGIRSRWINVFLGNPLRGDPAPAGRLRCLAAQLDRLAMRCDRDIVVSGSPRTGPECYEILSAALTSRHYLYRWTAGDRLNPFEAMLTGSGDSVVTADSITMISQLVAAGHRTRVFPWRPRSRTPVDAVRRLLRLQHRSHAKDTSAFCAALYEKGLAAELDGAGGFEMVTPQSDIQNRLFQRLRDFIR